MYAVTTRDRAGRWRFCRAAREACGATPDHCDRIGAQCGCGVCAAAFVRGVVAGWWLVVWHTHARRTQVRALGADEVIDYNSTDVVKEARAHATRKTSAA